LTTRTRSLSGLLFTLVVLSLAKPVPGAPGTLESAALRTGQNSMEEVQLRLNRISRATLNGEGFPTVVPSRTLKTLLENEHFSRLPPAIKRVLGADIRKLLRKAQAGSVYPANVIPAESIERLRERIRLYRSIDASTGSADKALREVQRVRSAAERATARDLGPRSGKVSLVRQMEQLNERRGHLALPSVEKLQARLLKVDVKKLAAGRILDNVRELQESRVLPYLSRSEASLLRLTRAQVALNRPLPFSAAKTAIPRLTTKAFQLVGGRSALFAAALAAGGVCLGVYLGSQRVQTRPPATPLPLKDPPRRERSTEPGFEDLAGNDR
jgi:hypothetical protein